MGRIIRFLIILIVLCLVAATVLFLIGGRERLFTAQTRIDASPSVVFSYLTEPEKISRWVDGIVKIEPLTEGGHQLNAKARITVQQDGVQMVMEDEVLKTEPDESLVTATNSSSFGVRNDYRLEPDGESTRVTYNMVVTPKAIMRFSMPFVKDTIQVKVSNDVRNLKKVIESDHPRQDSTKTTGSSNPPTEKEKDGSANSVDPAKK